jgi:transcriptional regulator with GAF, ATPase, and Fis domain
MALPPLSASNDSDFISGERKPGRKPTGLVAYLIRWWRSPRWVLITFSLGVIIYSFAVLWRVAWMGDIGVRCVFGRMIQEEVDRGYYHWTAEPPHVGDFLIQVDDRPILLYTDYVQAIRELRDEIGQRVAVKWRTSTGELRQSEATVRYRPLSTYIWSFIWFMQEMLIFGVGARVFWKRPRDESARLFFWLCIVTVGAFMGGYHWSEIVIDPLLIYLFAAFAVFVPVVSLHFYLVFPRLNPIFAKYRRAVSLMMYGLPAVYLLALWSSMAWSRYNRGKGGVIVENALAIVRYLALGYIALAVAIFFLCILCLAASFRAARTQAERNQVRWVLLASLVALPFIAYLLWQAFIDQATLGLDRAAWPMFVVSLLYTVAYSLSITRYKLMQVEEIYNRGKVYLLVSVLAGLLYSGTLVLSALVIGLRLSDIPTSSQSIVVALTAIVILIVSGATRGRFQKVIDRRFYREKYKFDQAMRKMSQAVDSLVDRATLGRRLLEAAADVLRLEWGAIYLVEGLRGPLRLVACHGPEPEEKVLTEDNPLVERLRQTSSIRLPHSMAPTSSDLATDAMIALGGEVANALEAHGALAGLLVLGPKRNGLPYEDEEIAFLGALASVATLALSSAGIQQTLESLNRELRDKVEKIAEQQRRILILQDQLMDRGDASQPPSEPVEPTVFEQIKGTGRAVKQMLTVALKVAASPSAVLIRGESGTGKELLAEAIHAASARSSGPFVKVHCAALSQSLLESELFGHVKGAFTGADRDRVGRFEQADGGTLFLDEIGDINLEVQTKLLRVLQEMAFERVGSSQAVSVDVRIVAATHQDLEALIRSGRFREDLYYRLNVISIRTPSLRERKEDVFELAVHFLGRHAQRIGKSVTHLDVDAIEALVAYDWPGNIRELENVLEASVVLADGPALTLDDLPDQVRHPSRRRMRWSAPIGAAGGRTVGSRSSTWDDPSTGEPITDFADDLDTEVEAYERQRLLDALDEARSNKSEAARLLGMPRSTFFSKLKKHGLA